MSRQAFVQMLQSRTPHEGANLSPWPGLRFYRAHAPKPPSGVFYRPSLCLVGQGRKSARIGDRVYYYDPLEFLVLAVPMPAEAQILEASPSQPFLSLVLEIDMPMLNQLLIDMADGSAESGSEREPSSGIFVSRVTPAIITALMRFVRAVERPMERRILAPMCLREILYHLLNGDQGRLLVEAAANDSRSSRVAQVIHHLEAHYDQPVDVPSLAKSAGMSTSSFHHTFKAVTSLSPIQYLKNVRLHKARLLMVDRGLSSGEAAHLVGYGSPSQFSREFKRLFGEPPTREVERFRASAAPGLPAQREPERAASKA